MKTKYMFEDSNPFIGDAKMESSPMYYYRKCDLNNGIVLVARCEHDTVLLSPQGNTQR